MITREQPQLWIPSTAGTAKSLYLRGKVDSGRQRVDAGLTDAVAYFEWSAPGEADPGSMDTWQACMPALGHTINEKAIRAEFERMDLPEFRRAYLNQWPDDAPDEWLVIPKGPWMALADPQSAIKGRLVFSIDMTPDRSFTALGASGKRADGLRHVEVIDHKRGSGWTLDRAIELDRKWHPIGWVVDPAGPAGSLIAGMEAAGLNVIKPTARDAMQACGQFYDAVMDTASLRHRGQEPLNTALAGADRRPLGDGWAWDRKALSADISPLVAVTNASWGFEVFGHEEEINIANHIW